MHLNQIHDFLGRYAIEKHSEEEHVQFTNWLQKAPVGEIEQIAERYREISENNAMKMTGRSHLISRIESALDETKAPVIKLYNRAWFRVAAAILIVMTGAFVFNRVNKKSPVLVSQVKEIEPGSNKAVLIMGDGKEIILDKTSDHLIKENNGQEINNVNGSLLYNTTSATTVIYHTVKVPRKGQYQLQLSDGTKVWINSESVLKFPTVFAADTRTVEITGEAYFEVAKNVAKPFHVIHNNMDIKVLGTRFNVNSYSDERNKKITLLEGSINVATDKNNMIIRPGQQAKLDGDKINLINDADTEEAIAWKEGRFQFKDADLKSMMRQITRWYDVDVKYNGNITDRYFTADIDRSKNLSAVLRILEMSDIHCRIEGKKLIVTP